MKSTLINWTYVSQLLKLSKGAIRSDYSGKKYAKIVNRIKKVERALIAYIERNINK